MILITGATGQFGQKVIYHLLNKGVKPSEISALVRDIDKAKTLTAQGVNVKVGDYTKPDLLVQAFQGVDKLLLVSSNDRSAVENRTAQHINVIEAAKEAQVKHIVYTSFIRKSGFEESAIADFQHSHVQTENCLKSIGVHYTILQNGMYLEMIPVFTSQQIAEGKITFPAADGKASFVLREELAEAAAHVLITHGHENQIYRLTNTQSVSFNDIAHAISHTTEQKVTYQPLPISEYEVALKQLGTPDLYIHMFTMWAKALSQNTMDAENDTLMNFLGRMPITLQQFISQAYGKQ